MTSPSTLIQRAAELVIAFGLEHTGLTDADVRRSATGDWMLMLWRLPTNGWHHSEIELLAVHRTDGFLETRTYVKAQGRDLPHAQRVADLYGRVVALAERIEALR